MLVNHVSVHWYQKGKGMRGINEDGWMKFYLSTLYLPKNSLPNSTTQCGYIGISEISCQVRTEVYL